MDRATGQAADHPRSGWTIRRSLRYCSTSHTAVSGGGGGAEPKEVVGLPGEKEADLGLAVSAFRGRLKMLGEVAQFFGTER